MATTQPLIRRTSSLSRRRSVGADGLGSVDPHHSHHRAEAIDSLTFVGDESDAWRAHLAIEHFQHRGKFWNKGKHETLIRYCLIALVGIAQASVAYFMNITSSYFIDNKYEHVYELLQQGYVARAYFYFVVLQAIFAMIASAFVWIEPVAAGSGIPEVKVYLNGIDLPRVLDPKTLVCKVLGVIFSVSAGLPVGKEGPNVHSGASIANCVSSGQTRNDREKRDYVTCGAAAGVCTAFSAPIGGILFSLEEGASYWAPSLTWKTFFCSMIAFTTLLCLNTILSEFGKVGFNKLFSFGNFEYEGRESSFAVFELALFVTIGMIGGMIGAIFNDVNENITDWRIKKVNHSKLRRFVEVVLVSLLVSTVSFVLPLVWGECRDLPDEENMSESELELRATMVPFLCTAGEEYNEVASLIFTDPGVAIRQLFHLHKHAFGSWSLFLFFISYISLAVLTYGIAVPSGLFVPSLLSGAAFGRLFGNMAQKYFPRLAFSNTYALIGAAAVLGGMARMTISLTVILLECTGNEQFVLPLMVTLMTARISGAFWNDDLYHIHIHKKKGVHFLEAELRSVTRHDNLVAGQVMSQDVMFVRPVEKVGVIYDILKSCKHTNFPIVDKNDDGVLFGTIGRNALCILLKQRAYGKPRTEWKGDGESVVYNYLTLEDDAKFLPLVQWEVIERAYPKYPSIKDIRISEAHRECYVDLRPYANNAPITIRETASISRTYEVFRSLGVRFLPVVNSHNKVVGTITRTDLTPEALAEKMIGKGARKNL